MRYFFYQVLLWAMRGTSQPGVNTPLTFHEMTGHSEDDIPAVQAPAVKWWEWPARIFFGPNFRGNAAE